MRIFGRHDAFLIGGLAIAVFVVSSRPLGELLDRAREIDHSRGLQLVPALFILAVVFLVNQVRKREEMRIEVVFQWTEATEEIVKSYVNGIPTGSGGTHENGLRAGVAKAIRNYIDTHNLTPRGVTLLR